jgi:hypothetical protein
MGICWFCYWGWPKPVADIYLKALAKLDGYDSPLHFGPAHIIWDDENFDRADAANGIKEYKTPCQIYFADIDDKKAN